MTPHGKLRGHDIYFDGQQFRYSDNHQSTIGTWKDRPCGHCGQSSTPEGHDGCLGTLPGVSNACCGHGVDKTAYIQYTDGTEVRGDAAIKLFGKGVMMNSETKCKLGLIAIILALAAVALLAVATR